MLRNNNKVFTAAPSSVGFAATFSHRAKALMAAALKTNGLVVMLGFFTKDFYAVPFRGSTERAHTKTKKLPLFV